MSGKLTVSEDIRNALEHFQQQLEKQNKKIQELEEQTKRIPELEEQTKKIPEQTKRIQELEEQTKRIPELEEQLAFLNLRGVQSKSHIAVYNFIEKNGGFVQDETLVFAGISMVDDSLVNLKWSLIKDTKLPSNNALEVEYQNVSNQVFDKIIHSDYLILHKKKTILMPDLIPNLSIMSAGA